MRTHRALALIAAALTVACGSAAPTSPSTTTTTTVAPATLNETYSGTLVVGASRFYSFNVIQNGTVNLTLSSLAGSSVGSDVVVELAIGRPSGTGCSATTTANVSIDTAAPQITGTYVPGVYCARVTDIGNLPAAAAFVVSIEHS